MKHGSWLLVVCGALACCACSNETNARDGDKKDGAKGPEVQIDTFKSRIPADWKEEKPSNNLRIKQFRLPKTGDDKDDADLGISHIPGGGGSLDDNVKRWKGMFNPPEGKKIDDVFKLDKIKVGDTAVIYVDVSGTYKGNAFEKIEPKPNYRMLMVVFDSKNGPYYFRLVGPAKTVEAHKKGFDEWLNGLK